MPVATTTEAGRQVVSDAAKEIMTNATADRARKLAAAKKAADTLTPLGATPPAFAVETLPEPPLFVETPAPKAEKAARKFAISTVVAYRGREITITAEGMTLDQFCDLMDDRGYTAPAPLMLSAPIATADDLPDGYKLCKKHGAPMKPRSKQGDTWNSHNVGTADNPCWCKGYRGPDSPGYEVE
jgi:hypothetical protein